MSVRNVLLSTIFLGLFGFVLGGRLDAAASTSGGSSAAFGEGVTNGGAANGGAALMSSKRAMLSKGGGQNIDVIVPIDASVVDVVVAIDDRVDVHRSGAVRGMPSR